MAISNITSSTTKYTVVRGDTFSQIAQRCYQVGMTGYSSGYDNYVNTLKSFNPDVKNIDLIYLGQVLVLQDTPAKETTSKSKQAKITAFGWKAGQDATGREVFATWAWDIPNTTDHYEVQWRYVTEDGRSFAGSYATEELKESLYSAPDEAISVTFKVLPVAKTYKKGDNDVPFWEASWSTIKRYDFRNNPPGDTGTPTVTISGSKLTAKLNNLDINANEVEFQVVKNDTEVYKTGRAIIKLGTATFSCTLPAGGEYKVRCRGVRGSVYGQWSGYTDNEKGPDPQTGYIHACYATSSSSVVILWDIDEQLPIYDIQYTTVKSYFDSNPSGVTTVTFGSKEEPWKNGRAEIQGLETGHEYFFRIRGRSGEANSSNFWKSLKRFFTGENENETSEIISEYASVVLGSAPTAPTTWSDPSTTITAGSSLVLNWTHNALDGSRQTEASIELTFEDGQHFTVDDNGSLHPASNSDPVLIPIVTGSCETDSNVSEKEIKGYEGLSVVSGTVIRVFMTFQNTSTATLKIGGESYSIDVRESGSYFWNAGSTVIFEYDSTKRSWILKDNNADSNTNSFTLDTSKVLDAGGGSLKWRVKTAGVMENDTGGYLYGPYSIQRTVSIYAQPDLELAIKNKEEVAIENGGVLTSLPIYITATETTTASTDTLNQKPIGYYISIIANETYETVDNVGKTKIIRAGETVYSSHADTNSNPYNCVLSANNLTLENGVSYKINCIVSMNSGLTAQQEKEFSVDWSDEPYWPRADIIYNPTDYTVSIGPYCNVDMTSDELAENITLSVYRREVDGSFTEIQTGMNNVDREYTVDPHPALDYARYRIVALDNNTGTISYYDETPLYIGEEAIIIQWDEQWSNLYVSSEDESAEPTWAGSLLRLPYDITVSDSHSPDVELVNYIGRENPVSYYGTQIGHTSSWSVDIPKTDTETLYALRRLARYMGDVYVREPSGSGYWANIKVSYNQNHDSLIIPVSFSITRVEGGA